MVVAFDIETSGLDAYQDQIILIGIKRGGRIKQWKIWKTNDESVVISKCLKTLKAVPFYETIVGYNNLKFDVPFITTRLSVFGKMSSEIWSLLYRDRKWFDLYQFLGNDFRTLTSWLDKLGIERKYEDIIGRDIPKFYENKEYEKIEQHNRDDLNTSVRLYSKLRKMFPNLLPQ